MSKVPNNVVRISTTLNDFFRYWFEFLKPFYKLSDREISVITAFVRKRYELSKVVSDETLLDKIVMGDDVKREIREECNITIQYFQVVMSTLRKNKLIVDGKINKKFIPNIPEDPKDFKLMLYFELDGPSNDL